MATSILALDNMSHAFVNLANHVLEEDHMSEGQSPLLHPLLGKQKIHADSVDCLAYDGHVGPAL